MCGWNKDFGLLTDFEIQYMERLRRNGGCGGAGMMLTFFNDFFVIFRFCFFLYKIIETKQYFSRVCV